MLQRVQGKPRIKQTNACRIHREFVSMKKMQKLMKQKEPVFLCIIKTEEGAERKRRTRGNGKSKSVDLKLGKIVAPDSQGTTEKTKREHSKVVGSKKDIKTVEQTTKEVVEGVAKEHQEICEQYSQNIETCSGTSCLQGLPQNGRWHTQ